MTRRSALTLYLATAAVVLAVVAVLEVAVRRAEAAGATVADSVPAMVSALGGASISGREIGNQMLVHNMALFLRHPSPALVDTAYVGTSRTKVLRPRWMGQDRAVNSSGNSYNEISYGLLLQAEVARLRFPGLKRVYVESSLLLRRPGRLILEPDHRKYLPLLESILPLRDRLPGGPAFRAEVEKARQSPQPRKWRLHLLAHRADMRLSGLLPGGGGQGSIPVTQDGLFRELDASGQRQATPPALIPKAQQRPEITNENVKVQRMRDIPGWAPWDGLFDLFALWGRAHGIEVVLFQPPVRSDLHRFQQESGLAAHVADLQRVSREHGIPFIDLNRPELGYMDQWALFSDEDHMETCAGVVLLHAALDGGLQKFRERGELLPAVGRDEARKLAAGKLRQCGE